MILCHTCHEMHGGELTPCPVCRSEAAVIGGYVAFAPELALANDGFEASFYPHLAPLEEGNFWFRARNKLIFWAIQRFFPSARNALEIGCGTGFVLRGLRNEFPNLCLSGSEIFIAGLDVAATRLRDVNLFQMDARKMPFDSEFDIIGAFDVLEHIDNDDAALSEMFRSVKPGGGIALTVPQHRWLWSRSDEAAHHHRRYTAAELQSKVTRAGFKVVYCSSFVSLLLPLMMVSRVKKRHGKSANADRTESLTGWLNSLFERVMDFERFLLRLGLRMPAGGSLLLVARRL